MSLHSFLAWVHIPVEDDLQGDDSVDEATAEVSEDEDLVPCLLDTGEDPSDGANAEQEACDGRELAGVTILEVGNNLDEFPLNFHVKQGISLNVRYFLTK